MERRSASTPGTTPEALTTDEVTRLAVAMAVWAPSVHNTQPWWFSADGPQISLYADIGRRLTVADPEGREMMVSCGAALFTLRLALRSLGYIPETCVLPDPGEPLLVARVGWRQRAAVTEDERHLVSQVRRRRTHRGGFDPAPLPPGLLAALRASAARDGRCCASWPTMGGGQRLQRPSRRRNVRCSLTAHVQELIAWAPAPGSQHRPPGGLPRRIPA